MRVLDWAISLCGKTGAWLSRFKKVEEQEPEVNCYDTLAPKTINSESMQAYFHALKYALSRNEVRNIAVTGNYGAGKSTVISSFMKYHCRDKFINVSLAGFDMTESSNTVSLHRQDIELSILQQILYKEEQSVLPDSRIDRIQNKDSKHSRSAYYTFLKIAFPIAILFGTFFFKKVFDFIGLPSGWYESFEQFINDHPNSSSVSKIALILILIFISSYSIIEFASRIGIFDKKIKLNKISLLGGDLEVDEKEQSSLLNNCLDEIVYFFARSEYKIVIFEDLDRLGSPGIFVKLREINKIINNNISDDNPVRFIYAVRDDLFSGISAKAKFFDFILPVISFMDIKNSYVLLKNKISFDAKNERYLKDIAIYITDMRSLLNILNEYHIFKKIVDNKQDEMKLLSMVFYKNTFPLDYNLSDKKTGILYSFVHDYRTRVLHASYFKSSKEKLDELKNKLDELNNEKSSSPHDIIFDIITRIIPKKIWALVYFRYTENGYWRECKADELINEDIDFISLFSKIELCISNGKIQEKIDDDYKQSLIDEYIKRKAYVENGVKELYSKVSKELFKTREEVRTRNSISLSELISTIGRNRFADITNDYLDKIKGHDYVTEQQHISLCSSMRNGGIDALYVLLSKGLLLQDYMSYRSIFYEGGLSTNDNDFIKAVGKDIDFECVNENYFIENEAKVVDEFIDQNRIYSDGALHYQIITHLIKTNSDYFPGVITVLFKKTDSEIASIISIFYTRFDTAEMLDNFIVKAFTNKYYLDRILTIVKINKDVFLFNDIAVSIISGISPEFLVDMGEYRKCIYELGSRIISRVPESKSKYFMNHLKIVDIKYEELFLPITDVEIFCIQFVANNNLYKITKDNVGIVISCLLNKKEISPEIAQEKPWTYISENNLTKLIGYFTDNIDDFIRDVFVYSSEDEKQVKHILKIDSLSNNSMLLIFKEMTFKFLDLSGLESDEVFDIGDRTLSFHDMFYWFDHVIPGWGSLLKYIGGGCNKNVLNKYISQYSDEFGSYEPESHDEYYGLLYDEIICNDNLSEPVYLNMLNMVRVNISKLDLSLSFENFSRLIGMNKIELNEELYRNYILLHDIVLFENSEVLVTLFSQYKEIFMEDPTFYLGESNGEYFFETVLSKLMNSELFSLSEKVKLTIIFDNYYLACEEINLSKDILVQVLRLSNNKEFKVKLFAKLISTGYSDKKMFVDFCQFIDEESLKSVFTQRTQATITATDENNVMTILIHLKAVHIIKSYQHRDDGKFFVSIKSGLASDFEMECD